MQNFKLYNGFELPPIGYGTYKSPDGPVCANGVKHAIKTGYKLIDTAYFYANEVSVKRGIDASNVCPDDILITTKLWNDYHGYDNALKFFDVSAKNLGREVVDLYLIHWPIPYKHRGDWKTVLPETWSAFEKLYKDGRVRAIGVCNCLPHHLDVIADKAEFLPMVNQIEFHIGFTQDETVKYCKENNIILEAWAPIAKAEALDVDDVLQAAKNHGKTAAQVYIRYCIQKGLIPLPKSVTPSRIEENFDVFDFELTDVEMSVLDKITAVGKFGSDPDNLKF